MKIPIENKGKSPIYVAGVMIPDGETRHFDIEQLPPEYRPQQEAAPAPVPAPASPLEEILRAPVKTVLAGVDALTLEALQALLELEQGAEKPRSTLVGALQAEVLERIGKQADGGAGTDDLNAPQPPDGAGDPPAPDGDGADEPPAPVGQGAGEGAGEGEA